MLRSAFFVFLAILPALYACSRSEQSLSTQVFLHSTNACELIFKSQNAVVIENFCDTAQKPILIKLADQEIRSDWIDEQTSRFLFQEGCAKADECFYELTASGSAVRGRFLYRINMTEGEYHFEVDESGLPKVLSKSSRDIAS
jgi:hypothetical protein